MIDYIYSCSFADSFSVTDAATLLYCWQARLYLDPAEIFKSEAEEAHEKTRKAIEICTCFKEHFEEDRKNIQKFFKEGQEVKQWEFANELVFTRIDQFVKRLKIVEVSLCKFLYCHYFCWETRNFFLLAMNFDSSKVSGKKPRTFRNFLKTKVIIV